MGKQDVDATAEALAKEVHEACELVGIAWAERDAAQKADAEAIPRASARVTAFTRKRDELVTALCQHYRERGQHE